MPRTAWFDELARAWAQLVAGQVYKLDSMFAQAMEIGQLDGGWHCERHSKRIIEKFRAVTVEAVQAVARKYFVDERLTVAELDPLLSAPLKEAGHNETAPRPSSRLPSVWGCFPVGQAPRRKSSTVAPSGACLLCRKP